MPGFRRLLPLLATGALVLPGTAHAQSQDEPGLSEQPPTTTTPSAPKSTPSRPSRPSATAPSSPSSAAPLPRTGAEIPGMALLGLGLLTAGLGLRLRTLDDTIY